MQRVASISAIAFLVLASSLQAHVEDKRDKAYVDGDGTKFQPLSSSYDKRQFLGNFFQDVGKVFGLGGSNPQTINTTPSLKTIVSVTPSTVTQTATTMLTTPTQSLTSTMRPTTASSSGTPKMGNVIGDIFNGVPVIGPIWSSIFGGGSSGNTAVSPSSVTQTTSTILTTLTPTKSLTITTIPTVATTASNSDNLNKGNAPVDPLSNIPIIGPIIKELLGGSSSGNINSNINVDASIGLKQNNATVQGINLPSTSSTVQVSSVVSPTITPVVASSKVNLPNLSNMPSLQNVINGLSNVLIGNESVSQAPPAKVNVSSVSDSPFLGPMLSWVANAVSNLQNGNNVVSTAQPAKVNVPSVTDIPIIGPVLNGMVNAMSNFQNGNNGVSTAQPANVNVPSVSDIPIIGPMLDGMLNAVSNLGNGIQPTIKPNFLSNLPPFGDIFRNPFPTPTNPANISSVNQVPILGPIFNSVIGVLRGLPIIGPIIKNIFPGDGNGNNYIYQIPFIGSFLRAATACLSHFPLIGQLFGPPSPNGCLYEIGRACGNITISLPFLQISLLCGPCGVY